MILNAIVVLGIFIVAFGGAIVAANIGEWLERRKHTNPPPED